MPGTAAAASEAHSSLISHLSWFIANDDPRNSPPLPPVPRGEHPSVAPMLKNYIRIFLRHIKLQKTHAFINIVGLAVGMAACILIMLFVRNELSHDNMHAASDRTYRVLTIDKALGTNNQRVGITMPAIGPALPGAFPEVEDATRLTFGGRTLLRHEDEQAVYAEQMRSGEADFFEFFDFPLLTGDPQTALAEPNSIVLTETLASNLFGSDDPLGQSLRDGNGTNLTVTGVMADLPPNTHLDFDALGSIRTLETQARANQPEGSTNPIWLESWGMIAMPTYVRFADGTDVAGFDARFTQLARNNSVSENFDITLQKVSDVHLKSTDVIFDPVTSKGDLTTVYVFAAIAFVILVIAIVNYMNLATARSTDRAREVGMRKVVGSTHRQLVTQYLGESLMTTTVALLLSVGLAFLALPLLNNLGGTRLVFDAATLGLIAVALVVLLVVVGVLAGIYPAFALARFQPITVLRGSFRAGREGRRLRVGLVVFQFALSIALIGSTAIVQKQLRYIQSKDVGYDREQVIVFDMVDGTMAQNMPTFRDELMGHSAFLEAAGTGNLPGRTFGRTRVRPDGVSDEDIWIWSQLAVTPEFLPTLGMDVAEGRNFSRDRGTDSSGVAMVNETAIDLLGWEEPIGRRLYFGLQDSVGTEVVGVVRDFHFAGIHQNIEPVVIFPLLAQSGSTLAARIGAGRASDALRHAEQTWMSIFPDYPFEYSFLDEEFDALYTRDRNTGRVVNIFSGLAILIACLGLFGLASYTTTQRTKEIGVRKVMGASSQRVTWLLVTDFVRWVALASIIAWPLAWWGASRWLDGFAYRVSVDPLLLLAATTLAIGVSIATVYWQSWRVAATNPARALRYE